MSNQDAPLFSFVLPAHNEAGNVPVMAAQLIAVGESLGAPFEVVWVNDGSTDETGAALDAAASGDARIRAIHFSRNFGHMAALTAGLEAARATGAVICLDSDGQHPPALIPEMVRMWREGADIVQSIRRATKQLGLVKRITSDGFYWLFNALGDVDIPAGAADFRLMDAQVVAALNSLPERERFIRGLVHWIGYRRAYLPYEQQERLAGETKYNLYKMLRFALSGLTSFSVRPLRLSLLMSVGVTLLAFLYAVFVLLCYVAGVNLTPGWPSLLLTMMLLGAAQLLAIGIASEYLARMFVEQKRRPIYIVRHPDARDGADDTARV